MVNRKSVPIGGLCGNQLTKTASMLSISSPELGTKSITRCVCVHFPVSKLDIAVYTGASAKIESEPSRCLKSVGSHLDR